MKMLVLDRVPESPRILSVSVETVGLRGDCSGHMGFLRSLTVSLETPNLLLSLNNE